MEKIIKKLLKNSKNEIHLLKNIMEFLGNCCQKCNKNSKYLLINVISIESGNFNFIDLPSSKYILKKFCKNCCYYHCTFNKIYIEI